MVAKDRTSEPSSSDPVVIYLTVSSSKLIAVVQIRRTNGRTEGAVQIKSS